MVKPKEAGKPFDKKEYYNSPDQFEGKFHEYLDSVNWLVNCLYWEAKYPRVLSKDRLKEAITNGTN